MLGMGKKNGKVEMTCRELIINGVCVDSPPGPGGHDHHSPSARSHPFHLLGLEQTLELNIKLIVTIILNFNFI